MLFIINVQSTHGPGMAFSYRSIENWYYKRVKEVRGNLKRNIWTFPQQLWTLCATTAARSVFICFSWQCLAIWGCIHTNELLFEKCFFNFFKLIWSLSPWAVRLSVTFNPRPYEYNWKCIKHDHSFTVYWAGSIRLKRISQEVVVSVYVIVSNNLLLCPSRLKSSSFQMKMGSAAFPSYSFIMSF